MGPGLLNNQATILSIDDAILQIAVAQRGAPVRFWRGRYQGNIIRPVAHGQMERDQEQWRKLVRDDGSAEPS